MAENLTQQFVFKSEDVADQSLNISGTNQNVNVPNCISNNYHDFVIKKEDLTDQDLDIGVTTNHEFGLNSDDLTHQALNTGGRDNFVNIFRIFPYINQDISLKSEDLTDQDLNIGKTGQNIMFECNTNVNQLVISKSDELLQSLNASEIEKCDNESKYVQAHVGVVTESLRVKDEDSLMCKICHKIFSEKSKLNKHTLIHTFLDKTGCPNKFFSPKRTITKPYSCNIGNKQIAWKSTFQKREVSSIDKTESNVAISEDDDTQLSQEVPKLKFSSATYGKSFNCKICHKNFLEKSQLVMHALEHTDAVKFICPHCSIFFPSKELLNDHLLSHTDSSDKPYTCKVCHQKFTLHSELLTHQAEKFCCEVCGKEFKRKCDVESHFLTHKENEIFFCHLCGKKFKQKNSLRLHLPTHRDSKKFSCYVCAKEFKQKRGLFSHLLNHQGKVKFSCHVCGKAFKYKYHLSSHLQTHEQIFACQVCEREFPRQCELKVHLLTHKKYKQFYCDLCGIKFGKQVSLKSHLLIHKNNGKFCCHLCNKEFNRKGNLKLHLRISHRDFVQKHLPLFSCPGCDKKFKHETSMELHMNATNFHQNIFSCLQCKRQFNRKSYLVMHMSRVHNIIKEDASDKETAALLDCVTLPLPKFNYGGKKQLSCEICNKRFSQISILEHHRLTHVKKEV